MRIEHLLTMMMGLNNETDATDGGSDESRSIVAVQMAMQYVETVAASVPRVLSTRGIEPIYTANGVESTPLPPSLLRVDKLWACDPSTGEPTFPMMRIDETGGHTPALPWPLNYVVSPSNGQPRGYYLDSDHLFWLPKPDDKYPIRAYGLWAQEWDDKLDRKSLFPFPNSLALPVATFAVKYGNIAIGDDVADIQKAAVEVFTPALRALRKRDRSRPHSRAYAFSHTT